MLMIKRGGDKTDIEEYNNVAVLCNYTFLMLCNPCTLQMWL